MDKSKSKKRGPQRPNQEKEFDQRVIDLARVTRVMAGGKRMRFRACVAIGDRAGKFGIGLAKGADVSIAINKAVNQAKKNMVEIPIVKNTIPHRLYIKSKAAKILLKPAPEGTGIKAGGAIRMVLDLAGVPNITCKILGSNNKINNVRALVEAVDQFVVRGTKLQKLVKPALGNKPNDRSRSDKKAPFDKKNIDSKPVKEKVEEPATAKAETAVVETSK